MEFIFYIGKDFRHNPASLLYWFSITAVTNYYKSSGLTQYQCKFIIFKKIIYLLIFSCAVSLLLEGLFSSYSKQRILCCSAQTYYIGFSCFGAWALEHVGFISCSSQVLEHRLNSCGARA
ncbi:unnamed protein product [Rangifer tarandus platyrhynchus]|uniref:Uncharacterized protein n=1 Tax=Rangifer tarandus platyrhynchus TaxID=3082113 RepID=A0ABN8XQL8_RANTA|nr:unnamed protein product [Rangifer tarandus platyrhynchus]